MLQSNVSCVNTRNIPQHSRESTWTKMEITSFVLKNLAGGGRIIGVHEKNQTEHSIFLRQLPD